MIKAKFDRDVPDSPVTTEGARDVALRILIGPDDGSDRIIMRRFRILRGGHTSFHDHDYEHVIHVQHGRGVVVHPDRTETPLEPGMSVFVPAGLDHQFRNGSDEPFEFLCTIPNVKRM
jgi:quercetin dioxygenase-like cupin family protein